MHNIPPGAPKNNQEAFDRMITHLAGMSEQCKSDGLCRYRQSGEPDDATCCPFGKIIPNDEYRFYFEKKPAQEVVGLLNWEHLDCYLLREVQVLHDDPWFFHSLPNTLHRINEIAEDYNLSMAILDDLKWVRF